MDAPVPREHPRSEVLVNQCGNSPDALIHLTIGLGTGLPPFDRQLGPLLRESNPVTVPRFRCRHVHRDVIEQSFHVPRLGSRSRAHYAGRQPIDRKPVGQRVFDRLQVAGVEEVVDVDVNVVMAEW